MEALGAAVLRGGIQDDHSQGHSLVDDPACRRIQEQFLMFAGSNLDELRRVLREAADDLQAATRDPDSTVRNNAVRALGVVAEYARKLR